MYEHLYSEGIYDHENNNTIEDVNYFVISDTFVIRFVFLILERLGTNAREINAKHSQQRICFSL